MLAEEGTYSRDVMTAPDVPFKSGRLRFRKLGIEDEPVLWELMSNQDVVRWIGIDPKTDRIETREQLLSDFRDGHRFKFFWAIHWKVPGTGERTGMIGWILFRPTLDGRSIEIGYWLLPEVWGKGVASEAASTVIDHLPPLMNLNREHITAMVSVGNHAVDASWKRPDYMWCGKKTSMCRCRNEPFASGGWNGRRAPAFRPNKAAAKLDKQAPGRIQHLSPRS